MPDLRFGRKSLTFQSSRRIHRFIFSIFAPSAKSGPEADNFYWLSTKPDVLDEGKSEWFVTPNKSFADFTALNQLPEATVRAKLKFETHNTLGMDVPGASAEVTLTNTGDTLAFFVEMRIVGQKSQQSLTPVFWDDNYISLPPHATKTFHTHIQVIPAGETTVELELQGWNVKFENVTDERINETPVKPL